MIDRKNLYIQHNRAIEFVMAIRKYTNDKTRQIHWKPMETTNGHSNLMDFTPNQKVKKWLEEVDEKISPFFRNELLFICDEPYRLFDICFHLILTQSIEEPQELLKALKSLDTPFMMETAYRFYELDAPLEDEDQLKEAITKAYSLESAQCFLQLKTHPEEYKSKILLVFEEFYQRFYAPYEEEVNALMAQRLLLHRELFKKDPTGFVNTLGLGDYTKAISHHDALTLFMSYYMDVGIIYFSFQKTLVMIYGQTIEHRFESNKRRDTYKSLFKALSDETRLSILYLTAKRPWYNKELADHFELSTATLSYHLNLLLELGILNFEPSIINNRYYYTANLEELRELFNRALDDFAQ